MHILDFYFFFVCGFCTFKSLHRQANRLSVKEGFWAKAPEIKQIFAQAGLFQLDTAGSWCSSSTSVKCDTARFGLFPVIFSSFWRSEGSLCSDSTLVTVICSDSNSDFTEQTVVRWFYVLSLSQLLSVWAPWWKHVLIRKPLFICGFGRHMAWERSAFTSINNKSDRPPTTRAFI